MKLDYLITKTLEILKSRNYTEKTWRFGFRNGNCSSIRKYFEKQEKEDFCVQTTYDYINYIQKCYENGDFSYSRCAHLKKIANWLIEVYETGGLIWKSSIKSKIELNPFYKSVLCDYIDYSSKLLSKSNVSVQKSVILHFMRYLNDDKKYHDFSHLCLKDVQDFIIYIRQKRKGRIDFVIHALKRFTTYLYENKIITVDLIPAFYMQCNKSRKILNAFSHEEIDKILSQPNRNTSIGKRDYAIILLGRYTGLRRGDIVNLKRTDIDWKNDELRIIQHKTGKQLILPLEPQVEYAVIDYLKNGRPKSNLPNIFLHHNAPHIPLSPQMMGALFSKHMRAAGIEHTPGDGKSFHGLRRSIACWMLEADVPLTTISQFLGHRQISSSNPYLSIDEKNLKQCTLPLDGIELNMEGLL